MSWDGRCPGAVEEVVAFPADLTLGEYYKPRNLVRSDCCTWGESCARRRSASPAHNLDIARWREVGGLRDQWE